MYIYICISFYCSQAVYHVFLTLLKFLFYFCFATLNSNKTTGSLAIYGNVPAVVNFLSFLSCFSSSLQ